jgi:hypothetical protein
MTACSFRRSNYAERDRLEERLSTDEETAVTATTGDLLELLSEPTTALPPTGATPLRVFGYGINGAADQLALRMLGELVKELPIALEISSARLMASELVSHVKTEGYGVVCLADLPPSPPSRTRLLVKRLRRAMPDVRIAVGRWTPPDLVAETSQPLIDAGASHVAFALLETPAPD